MEAVAAVRIRDEAGAQDSEWTLSESFLRSSLIRYWYSVSGKRFPYHFRQYLSDLLLPHSEVIEEAFAITATDLIDSIVAIEHALRFGPGVTQLDLEKSGIIHEFAGATQGSDDDRPLGEVPAWVHRAAGELNWPTTRGRYSRPCYGPGIFDVQRSADLPEALLQKLSWEPGEAKSSSRLATSPARL